MYLSYSLFENVQIFKIMNLSSKKLAIFIFFLGFFLQSCNTDDSLTETEITEELRGNRPGELSNGNGKSVTKISSKIVKEWQTMFLTLDRYSTGMRPNATARAIAYINLAAYETAIPGMGNHRSNTELLNDFDINTGAVPKRIDWRVALNSCYADVMNHFFVNITSEKRDEIVQLEAELELKYSKNVSPNIVEDSKRWGEYVAEEVIKYSQTDLEGESQILEPQPNSYIPPTGLGYWTFSADPERALFPHWGNVRTFVIGPENTTTIPPLEYSENPTSEYFAQMKEVYEVNNDAKNGNDEQLWIAEFWSDDVEGLMMSPPGRQVSIAGQLIEKNKLNLEESLTLFVKLGFSLNDAAVSTWKYKYDYMVMRPSVFIKNQIDADFQTNLFRLVYWPNPSFPGYPSGHSCFASAAGGVFSNFFGENISFVDNSHKGRTEFLGNPRKFDSFDQMARENAFSRIPLGVHVRMDCEEGFRLGYEISNAINNYSLDKLPS